MVLSLQVDAVSMCAVPATGVPEHTEDTVTAWLLAQPVDTAVQVILAEPVLLPVTMPV